MAFTGPIRDVPTLMSPDGPGAQLFGTTIVAGSDPLPTRPSTVAATYTLQVDHVPFASTEARVRPRSG